MAAERGPSSPLVERSVARVKPVAGGESMGLAFALDGLHVVTCAHVVNAALGRDGTDISMPADDELLLLELRAGSHEPGRPKARYAHVAVWLPDEGRRWFAVRDVAVLEVTEPLPDAVVRPTLARELVNGTVCMLGPGPQRSHEVFVNGEVRGEVEVDLLQVDERLDNVFKVEHGFSGGPVWSRDRGRVVGMLVAGGRGKGPRDVYVVASEVIDRAWGKVGQSLRASEQGRRQTQEGRQAQDRWRDQRRRADQRPGQEQRQRRDRARRWQTTASAGDLWTTLQRWLSLPALLAVSLPAGLVAFVLATGKVGLALSAGYGVRALAVVHAAGVVTGTVVEMVAGRRRDDAADPSTVAGA